MSLNYEGMWKTLKGVVEEPAFESDAGSYASVANIMAHLEEAGAIASEGPGK